MFKRLSSFFFFIFFSTFSFASNDSSELSEDWTQTFRVENLILNERSTYQNIVIFKNRTLGKILMLDDIIQLTDKDEFIYHEMLAHVPLFTHPKPQTVLIIGGGDGAVLREVLKHPTVHQVTVVELDGKLVDLCKKHFPHLAQNAFEDPRVRLLIDDGYKYLKKTNFSYDVIIVNTPTPTGPAQSLFKRKFYELCYLALNDYGILACQNGSPILQLHDLKNAKKIKEKLFTSSAFFFSQAPSQLSGIKSFSISIKGKANLKLPIKELIKRKATIDADFKYYSPETHLSAFYIPKYLQEDLK